MRSICGCPGKGGKRDVFCWNNLYYGLLFNPVGLFIINLNAFDFDVLSTCL